MGCDMFAMVISYLNLRISIHAPAWGATRLYFLGLVKSCISIHAPAWGATDVAKSLAY